MQETIAHTHTRGQLQSGRPHFRTSYSARGFWGFLLSCGALYIYGFSVKVLIRLISSKAEVPECQVLKCGRLLCTGDPLNRVGVVVEMLMTLLV